MERLDLSIITDKERVRLFLNYLDVFFQDFRIKSFGSSYFQGDSYFNDTNISGNINGKEETFFIRIVSSLDGNLKYLEFDDNKNGEFKEKINKLIIDSLMKSLDDKKEIFYRRYHYTYTGPQLDGEYWIRGIRIAPIIDDVKNKTWDNVERYFSIELNVSAIDGPDADAKGNIESDIIAARLSLLLDIGINPPITEHKWCIDTNDRSNCESKLYQTGYYGFGHNLKRMPKKKELMSCGKFNNSIYPHLRFMGDLLCLPSETRKLFSKLDNSSDEVQEAFNNCCFMYQISSTSGRYSPTVKLSYLVASIEALAQCGSSENKHFSNFIRHYAKNEIKVSNILDFMHGEVRSAHFHSGKFTGGEYKYERDSVITFQSVESRIRDARFRESYRLVRTAIANWINQFIGNDRELPIQEQ
ncbi:TPA: hypothetical protein NGT22_002410 [Vibrio parahaemolyticus]|nr:hypothetical protein [Vibrio parahaemolyticus]